MSGEPVYMIANMAITDFEQFTTYTNGFFEILQRYNGEFVTYDDNPRTFEGASPRSGRMAIFRFPSEQAAELWYNDGDYQSLSDYRRNGSKLEFLTMVRGLPSVS